MPVLGWRAVPSDPAALGRAAAAARPAFSQAIAARPVGESGTPIGDDAFERRLVVARRRVESAARAAAAPSPSWRSRLRRAGPWSTRGLVAGPRLAELYPDLAERLVVRYAVFHQRYATNTHPVWRRPALPGDRPQRRDQHRPR